MNKYKIWIAVAVMVIALGAVVGVEMADHKVAQAPLAPGSEASSSSTSGAVSTGAAAATATASSSDGGLTITFSTTTEKYYAGSSFSMAYPSSWTAELSPTFSLDSFGGKYQDGWMIPAGGAEIDVVTTTVQNAAAMQGIMGTELMSATNVSTSTQTVSGVACVKASYASQYKAGQPSRDTALYCLRGAELWKIYFSYHAGDAAAQQHVADFANVLGSLKFLP